MTLLWSGVRRRQSTPWPLILTVFAFCWIFPRLAPPERKGSWCPRAHRTVAMRLVRRLAMAVGSLAAVAGCSSLNHTENGALAGGGIGAATGALIGHATGHTAGGALIGAGAGALAGGLIGHAAGQRDNAHAHAHGQDQEG